MLQNLSWISAIISNLGNLPKFFWYCTSQQKLFLQKQLLPEEATTANFKICSFLAVPLPPKIHYPVNFWTFNHTFFDVVWNIQNILLYKNCMKNLVFVIFQENNLWYLWNASLICKKTRRDVSILQIAHNLIAWWIF